MHNYTTFNDNIVTILPRLYRVKSEGKRYIPTGFQFDGVRDRARGYAPHVGEGRI